MSSTKLNGHEVLVMLGESAVLSQIGAQRDCTLTINSEMVEKSLSADAVGRGYLPGLYDWDIQVGGLYVLDNTHSMAEYLLAGTELTAGIYIGDTLYTGSAYVSSFEATGNVRGKATYNVTLRGTGALATS